MNNSNRGLALFLVFGGAGAGLGLGHIMEGLTLARDWVVGGGTAEFLVNDFAPATSLVDRDGHAFRVFRSNGVGDWPHEVVQRTVAETSADVLVIDLPTAFFPVIGDIVRQHARTVVIMDNDLDQIVASKVLVNFNVCQNPSIDQSREVRPLPEAYFVGPDFAPIDKRKLDLAATNVDHGKPGPFVVTMGGTDPLGMTPRIIRALATAGQDLSVSVVLGAGATESRRADVLQAVADTGLECDVLTDLPQEEFYRLLYRAKAVITAPGNTLYELAYIGVVTGAVAERDGAERVAKEFQNRGLCRYLGAGAHMSDGELADVLADFVDLPDDFRAQAPNVIDGMGVSRIVSLMHGVSRGEEPVCTLPQRSLGA
jgi:spore coat polysaccharide biosynthesis predicted glycosyltransferase SpsG